MEYSKGHEYKYSISIKQYKGILSDWTYWIPIYEYWNSFVHIIVVWVWKEGGKWSTGGLYFAVCAQCFACALQQNQHFASRSDEHNDDFHVIPKVKANVAMSWRYITTSVYEYTDLTWQIGNTERIWRDPVPGFLLSKFLVVLPFTRWGASNFLFPYCVLILHFPHCCHSQEVR